MMTLATHFSRYTLKYSTKNNMGYSPKQGVLLKKEASLAS